MTLITSLGGGKFRRVDRFRAVVDFARFRRGSAAAAAGGELAGDLLECLVLRLRNEEVEEQQKGEQKDDEYDERVLPQRRLFVQYTRQYITHYMHTLQDTLQVGR